MFRESVEEWVTVILGTLIALIVAVILAIGVMWLISLGDSPKVEPVEGGNISQYEKIAEIPDPTCSSVIRVYTFIRDGRLFTVVSGCNGVGVSVN